MANDPNQRPTSYDPMTGQPIYGGAPVQPPRPTSFDPMTGQPIYGGAPPPPAPQAPNPYAAPAQPPANPYAQPPVNPYAQPPVNPNAAPPVNPYAAPAMSPAWGNDDGANLRAQANATVGVSDRIRFIRLTYIHLFGAVVAFALIMIAFFRVPFLVEHVTEPFIEWSWFSGRWNWLIVIGLFMVASFVADSWARSSTSRAVQYAGLLLYVVVEAVTFIPLIFMAELQSAHIIARGGGDPNILRDAAIATLALFGVLTATVVLTKKDFSMLRGALALGCGAAFLVGILSIIFGFNLGIVFAIAMVLLASGMVLYKTSQVLAHYQTEQYVAASLSLFASLATMFWYIIQIFMRMRR